MKKLLLSLILLISSIPSYSNDISAGFIVTNILSKIDTNVMKNTIYIDYRVSSKFLPDARLTKCWKNHSNITNLYAIEASKEFVSWNRITIFEVVCIDVHAGKTNKVMKYCEENPGPNKVIHLTDEDYEYWASINSGAANNTNHILLEKWMNIK